MRKRLLAAVLLGVCVVYGVFAAEENDGDGNAAQEGWSLARSVAGSVNPLGLTFDGRVFYTWPLFPDKRGVLWDSSRVEAGLHDSLTPAFYTASAFVRFAPAAVFDLSASAGLRGYYDVFGFGYTPLSGYEAPWDSASRKNADRFSAAGFRYSVTATLKGAAGPFAFASATTCTVYDMFETGGGADAYYDPSSDTVLKRFDGFVTNDSLALYTFRRGLSGGFIHSFLYVPGPEYVSRRVSLLCRAEGALNPSLSASAALLGGVFLQDRYNSWKGGKIYAAFQAGIVMKLGRQNSFAP